MLEFDVEISIEMAGDLAARVMARWPGLEVTTEENSVSFCLPVDDNLDKNLLTLEEVMQALEKSRNIPELNLNCKNLAGPDSGPGILNLGKFVFRRPDLEIKTVEDEQIEVILEPGMAFGTGGHPSTTLSLTAMMDFFEPIPGAPSREESRVLDVGTGSGILSLAACHLGRGPILAIDTDLESIKAASANIALNNIESRINVQQCAADKAEGEYDLILANLAPSVLARVGKKLAPLLSDNGVFIVAGFADTQAPHVVKSMTKAGLVTTKSYSRDNWTALAMIKS